ncbi:MAG: hypothetical protein ACRDTF_21905 [Pseudonocardiaceae bacterium]
MTWFVASLRDEDTHLAEDSTGPAVTARCSRSFCPLTGLAGAPPDPLQVCPACVQSQQVMPRSRKR